MGVKCSKESAVLLSAPPSTIITAAGTADDGSTGDDFLPFSCLNDDVILCILSYVSYSPFERDVIGTLTLEAISDSDPTPERVKEARRLVDVYNEGATRLSKKSLSRISPFRAPQEYYKEAFHGSSNKTKTLPRLSCTGMFGTLTHVLPLVCKRFHALCNQSNLLWIEALERQMGLWSDMRSDIGQGDLWEVGIKHFIEECHVGDDSTDAPSSTDNSDNIGVDNNEFLNQLIPSACDCVIKQQQQHEIRKSSPPAKEVFRQVLLNHKPIRLPVFSMFCPTSIGEEINLRLFEPRYRLLIHEILVGRSERDRKGFPLKNPRPRFLFANTWQENVACVVEVRRCLIRRDGISDISIVPTHWVILTELLQRPESGGLRDGVVMRAPRRIRLPAFCMRTQLLLGQEIRIRLFEDRYKTLIAEVMAGRTGEERNGSAISEPKPQFVFFCSNRFKEGSVACLVDIEQCRIHGDGTAQVTVVPTSMVLVESVKKRPNDNLYDASVLYKVPSVSQE
jgi:Lon protease-like protein